MNFKSLVNEIGCDSRIKNGTLDLKNEDHVFVLQEYLEKAGYDINEIVEKTARLFEAGRFPERQAYNKDGILVTFPNKQYRDRAVTKGTHFAENPKKAQTNIFTEPNAGVKSGEDANVDPSQEKDIDVSIDASLDKKIIIGFVFNLLVVFASGLLFFYRHYQQPSRAIEAMLNWVEPILFVLSIVLLIIVFIIIRAQLRAKNVSIDALLENKQLLQSIIDNTSNPIFIKM